MMFEAAVKIRINAESDQEAAERIKKVVEWAGFGCEVVFVSRGTQGEDNG